MDEESLRKGSHYIKIGLEINKKMTPTLRRHLTLFPESFLLSDRAHISVTNARRHISNLSKGTHNE